jgi:uncharacterized protein YndB with AHSA1/START domain
MGIRIAKLELRPGGLFHYCMLTPDGKEVWGRFVYREIVKPELLTFVVSFSDPQGRIARHPFSPVFPLEIMNAIVFSEARGKTTLRMRGWPINETGEERAAYEAAFAGMEAGFKGTLDQLEAHLAASAKPSAAGSSHRKGS